MSGSAYLTRGQVASYALYAKAHEGQMKKADAIRELRMYLDGIKEIIEAVDHRAMAADGPVTPTLKEITQAEMTEIYESAVNGANRANELLNGKL